MLSDSFLQIWKHAVRHIAEISLEGLSRVKPCNAVGRVAMASDLKDLEYGLRALLQPLSPELSNHLENSLRMVETYIKVSSASCMMASMSYRYCKDRFECGALLHL